MVDISGNGKYPPIILKGDPAVGGTLDANIQNAAEGRVLYVGNNKVTLEEGLTLTGGKMFWGGAVMIGQHGSESAGEFIMAGGEISGNSGDTGGAVLVYKGSFEMTGGLIKDNHGADGSAVYVYEDTTFTMSGGAIQNNGGNNATSGGGVYVGGHANFTMNGGDIAENSAIKGGGVYISSFGDFTITDGTIQNNTATEGGGVYVSQYGATFNENGGTITGNTPGNIGF
jgi:hypothetical protein